MEGRINYSSYSALENNEYYDGYTYKYDAYTGACIKEHGTQRNVFQDLLYRETFWCCSTPCTCGGIGCTKPLIRPYSIWQIKCCCLENLLMTTACWNYLGICLDLNKWCCLVTHFSCPPRGGSKYNIPAMAFCDYRCPQEDLCSCLGCAGEVPEDTELISKTFLLFYCWCFGVGLAEPRDPFIRNVFKCLCIQEHCYTADPCPTDRDCAFNQIKCCCCISACTYPSLGGQTDGIPACSICNYVLCGEPMPHDWWENKGIMGQAPVPYLGGRAPNCWPYTPFWTPSSIWMGNGSGC